jgi:hypothetical protein
MTNGKILWLQGSPKVDNLSNTHNTPKTGKLARKIIIFSDLANLHILEKNEQEIFGL